MRRHRPFLPFLLCLAAPLAAQAPAAAAKTWRVHVIGASVSGGFEDGPLTGASRQCESVPLVTVLKAWAGDDARVSGHSPIAMVGMFTEPAKIGDEQLAGLRRAKPDLVVAIDFPFWFAYGPDSADEAVVRERFRGGIERLATIECPTVVGDVPDMHGALPRMLHGSWIPAAKVLTELNEQLAAFVKANPRFRLVPLAATVRTMKEQGVVLPLAGGALRTPPGALLQEDRLHATRLGMAFLGHTLQESLAACFPEGHVLRARSLPFEPFVEAAAAEDDLDEVREAAGKAEKAPAGGGGR